MRLSIFEVNVIKQVFLEVFGGDKIYLFGSRVNDAENGGDIDLYIKTSTDTKISLLPKKIEFLYKLKKIIGEQAIDVIIARDKNRLIEKEALMNGVEL